VIDLLKYWLFTLMIGGTTFLLSYFATKMVSGPYAGVKGKLPSWRFKIKKYRIHLHHWFVSLIASLLLIKYYFLFSFTQFIILLGIALGIAAHGIKNYSDWRKVISKEQDL